MAPRLKLQELLEAIQGNDHVYFQAPPREGMEYPCILYIVDGLDTKHADNLPYNQTVEYLVTVIDRDPDNETWRNVGRLSGASFNRFEVKDNLNHYYFSLYF